VLSAGCNHDPKVQQSVGQVERIRSGVTVTNGTGEHNVRLIERLSAEDRVKVDASGRAVLSLDGGGRYILDHNTQLRIADRRVAVLEQGRLWIAGGGEGGRAEESQLRVGESVLHLRGARASVTASQGHASVSVLSGEIAYESGSRRGAIRTGESAELTASAARVVAQTAYEDWTGGLADDVPSMGGDSAGLGSVAARTPGETGQPRWPMVMQKLESYVTIRGDLAITTIDQTFFNPSGDTVEGLYTFNTPPGAVLQMFGVDRHGNIVEGRVQERQQAARQYQQQVYRGSTHDPALLEWDAPGRYHAKLYPIAAGSTRRVRVRYTQWLSADARGHKTYRLPLASLDTRIGEFRADFDLDDASVTQVRAGAGAVIDRDHHLVISQSDVMPRADLVVELEALPTGEATAQRVPLPGDPRGGFVRVAVRSPVQDTREAHDEGVDLVIVVDHSAATDELALRLEQAFVESLLGNLDARDAVLVLAGDVTTRAVGAENTQLSPVTPERRRQISEALTRDHLGGATDLSAMIASAHRALRPGRNGAIVYVGDGHATVGENALPTLRAMMGRLSPRPRFYAVAVGEEPRLDLLDGIASPAGLSRRITRRGDVARTSLELLEHASRPLLRNVRVDLGAGVTAVYPAEPVDLPVGEPITVVGRYPGDTPRSVTIRALWNGQELTRTYALSVNAVNDSDDLRYRWATARLENLLARGETPGVIVELGTRFGLITPFTSLYVPSEDEVGALELDMRRGPQIPSSFAQLELTDLLPLVGCAQRSRAPSRQEAPPTSQTVASSLEEGGGGQRHGGEGRRARYAIAQNNRPEQEQAAESPSAAPAAPSEPAHLSRNAARESANDRGVFAALGAPGGSNGIVSPFGGLAQDESENAPAAAAQSGLQQPATTERTGASTSPSRRALRGADQANGNMDGDAVGDAFGYGGLGARGTGVGGGGTGEGTIGLGNFGTMGNGSGTGSGQGYGAGGGGGLRGRTNNAPLARLRDLEVFGTLSKEVVRRVILRNLGQVTYCHEQGLATNPNLHGTVTVRFVIGSNGAVNTSDVSGDATTYPIPTVGQCIANATRRWQYPAVEGAGVVTVYAPFSLASADGDGGSYSARRHNGGAGASDVDQVRHCSDAASVPLAQRITLWRERTSDSAGSGLVQQYRTARQNCELPSWPDRVAFLRLMYERAGSLDARLQLYNAMAFDRAAKGWLRASILRALARSGELARAQELGLGRLDASTMAQALGVASTPAQKLNVLGELARRYPDDMDLATRYLSEAVAQNAQELVRTQCTRMRAHPQADAKVRTAAGEALFSIGDEAEARRTFSEIVEFAPDDPAARQRLGDIALSHGWADEAYRQFQMLAQIENDASEVLLRQAMAARMAGRLDEAIRLSERVAQESSAGNGTLGDVASAWIGVELALAANEPNAQRSVVDALRARWRLSSAARGAGALRVMVRWYHPDDQAEMYLQLAGQSPRRSDWVAGSVFFESNVFVDPPGPMALEIRRGEGARARGRAELILLWNEGQATEHIERRELRFDEQRTRYVFDTTGTSLTERPATASLVTTEGATAGIAAQSARTGGAR
jgi:Ca-activated chloride channel family protein